MNRSISPSTGYWHLAVVEDDDDLRENMVDFLSARGYPVWGVSSGEALYRRLLVDSVDALVLDVGLPGEDGFAVTRHVSQLGIAVIIVSGRNSLADRLAGLDAGADRYLTKPVDLGELAANIEAVRRHDPARQYPASAGLNLQAWRLNPKSRELHAPEGKWVTLTSREYELVRCLVDAGGDPVSKTTIAETLWSGSADLHRVDVILTRLRNKGIETLGQSFPIKTMPSRGLMLTVDCVMG